MDLMCKACKELFDGESNFIEHFMSKHTIRESMTDVFKERALRRQPPSHFHPPSICVCDICYTSTTDMKTLADHILTHVGALPYFCETCDFTTISKLHLRQHLLKHMDQATLKSMIHYNFDGLHECEGCNSHFPTWKELVCHYVEHLKSMPFICEECNVMFSEKRDFTIHNHLHTYSSVCDICNGSFHSHENLLVHVLTHDTSKFFNKFSKRPNVIRMPHFPQNSPSSVNLGGKCIGYRKTLALDKVISDREKSLFNINNESDEYRFGMIFPHTLGVDTDKKVQKFNTNTSRFSKTKKALKANVTKSIKMKRPSHHLFKVTNKALCSNMNVTKLESKKSTINRSQKLKKRSECIKKKKTGKQLIATQPNSRSMQSKTLENQILGGTKKLCGGSSKKATNNALDIRNAENPLDFIKPVSVTLERLPAYVQDMPSYKKYCTIKKKRILETKKKCALRQKNKHTKIENKSHQKNLQFDNTQKYLLRMNKAHNIRSNHCLPTNDSSKSTVATANETFENSNSILAFEKNFNEEPETELVKNLKECSVMLDKLPSYVTDMCSFKKYIAKKEIKSCIKPRNLRKKLKSKTNKSSNSMLKIVSSSVKKIVPMKSIVSKKYFKPLKYQNLRKPSPLSHIEPCNHPQDATLDSLRSQNSLNLVPNKASTFLLPNNNIKKQDSIHESLMNQSNLLKNNLVPFSNPLTDTDKKHTKSSNSFPSAGSKIIELIPNKASSLLSNSNFENHDSIPETLMNQRNILKNKSVHFSEPLTNSKQKLVNHVNAMPSGGRKFIGLIPNKARLSLISSSNVEKQDSISESLMNLKSILKNNSEQPSKPLVNTDQKSVNFSNMPSAVKKSFETNSNSMKEIPSEKQIGNSQVLRAYSKPQKTVKQSNGSDLKTLLNKSVCSTKKAANCIEAPFTSIKHSIAGKGKSIDLICSIKPTGQASTSNDLSDFCDEDSYISQSDLNELSLSSQLHHKSTNSSPDDNLLFDNQPSPKKDLLSNKISSHPDCSAEALCKSDNLQNDAKEKSPKLVKCKKAGKKRQFSLSDILPSSKCKKNFNQKKTLSKLVRTKNCVACPKSRSKPLDVVLEDGINTTPIQKRISKIHRALNSLMFRNNSWNFGGRKTPLVELIRLPDSIYQKYNQGKPILLSSTTAIDQRVQTKPFQVNKDHNYCLQSVKHMFDHNYATNLTKHA